MFLVGDVVKDPLTQLPVTVVRARMHSWTVRYHNGHERTDQLTSHRKAKLLFLEALNPSVRHEQPRPNVHVFYADGHTIRARWTGKQWQWAMDGKKSTQYKVWWELYLGVEIFPDKE